MKEREIVFQSENNRLSGTVTLPRFGESFPGVLLIPGSGQVDRNENAKKLQINVFREITYFLADNNIATLRYDKRGVGKSEGNFWETGLLDNASDALSALEYFGNYKGIKTDKIFLLGHSEGAIISAKLAVRGVHVAGIILLAGTAQKGEEILKWQAQQVVKGLKGFNSWLIKLFRIDVAKAQQKQIEKIKSSSKDWYRVQFIAKINAKWMREFLAYNPAEDLPKIKVPILAITGSKDIQVNPEDLKKMAELSKTDFEYHKLPNVTHILRKDQGEPSLSTYKEQVNRPMDSEILAIILNWLKKRI
ncbi:alpha/beta hydrolase [Chloroflexota bacterium]